MGKIKRKKHILLAMWAFLLMSIFVNTAEASESSGGYAGDDVQEGNYNGLTYIYDAEKVVITGYEGESPDVIIPPNIRGVPVTDIARQAFAHNWTIQSLTIEAEIQKISEECFLGSTLEAIQLPDTVTLIEGLAFSNCTKLAAVRLPSGLKRIENGAFYYCKSIKEVTIPDTVTYLDVHTFDFCESLESITLPETLTMTDISFYSCRALKAVKIPDQVTRINELAFQNCSSLSSVRVPEAVTEIANGAFENCYCLTEIYIPDTTVRMGPETFAGCGFLTIYGEEGSYAEAYAKECGIPFSVSEMPGKQAVCQKEGDFSCVIYENNCMINGYNGTDADLTIPDTLGGKKVTHLSPRAFANNYTVQNLTIEAQIELLPRYCFWQSALQNISLPVSLKKIDSFCFSASQQLKSIDIPGNVVSLGAGCFRQCDSLEEAVIPSTVRDVGDGIFGNCQRLRSVTLEEGITKVSAGMFWDCRALENISLPESLREIGEQAFMDCKSLNKIDIPEKITRIETYAFSRCTKLNQVNLPEGIIFIGDFAFSQCTVLGGIYIPGTVTEIRDTAFEQCDLLTICGGSGSYAESYARKRNILFSTEDVSRYITEIVLQEGIEYGCMFDRAIVLGEDGSHNDLVIPPMINGKRVEAIQQNAFAGKNSIYSCIIEAGIKELPDGFFSCCTELKKVQLPNTLEIIGEGAFSQCWKLDMVNFPDSLIKIGENAFFECKGLKRVDLPGRLERMENQAFFKCESLEQITIPDKIDQIERNTFYGCKKLVDISLPNGLKAIEERGFYDCEKLSRLYIPKTVTSIADNAFEDCYFLMISAPKGSYAIDYARKCGLKYIEINYDETTGGFGGVIPSDVIAGMGDEQEIPIVSDRGQAIFDIGAVIEIKHRHGNKNVIFNYSVVGKEDIENEVMYPAVGDAVASGGCVLDFSLVDSSGEDVLFHSEENDGIVTITIPYTAPVSANKITVYYIAPDGTKTDMNGSYDPSTKTVTFRTEHFSVFTIETDIDPCVLGHEYKETVIPATSTENGYTQHSCTRCSDTYNDGETDALGHDWDEGVVTAEPTYVSVGKKTWTCQRSGCGETKTEDIPMLKKNDGQEDSICSHPDDSRKLQNATAALCEKEGYTGDVYCGQCGAKLKAGSVIPALGHDWDEGRITVQPSAAEEGSETFVCKRCKKTRIESIPGLPAPAKGSVHKEDSGKAKYKITKPGASGGTVEYVSPVKKQAKVTIPATVYINGAAYKVTGIAKNAFKKNKTITKVTIGKNVEKIGNHAFYGCAKLKSVVIGERVKTIGSSAFGNCRKLGNITIKTKKLKGIGIKAFKGTKSKIIVRVPKSKYSQYKKILKKAGVNAKAIYKKTK